ncbi:MAG: prepilin-type N-terminal cleavage/methylation domain-containing protein [Acidobacteria bacterium]|nr:prepilin-type N-terminal cleavage/methylation domain-containing protein [Acidobacteriota bacterium]MBU4306542.1 prepilin-type N-terminal cleavage/methylation domain-containing protein [Acidobacteriota bacterium]MBU4405144.1 prepilin-type N-terminal cleavage/methylation domain-containing protein [Acidobacteriota bacterium]MCG2810742.1 prepilin-type N-terminal cleavage/methylation domain-containing protein [Candidatus Aminicenantes bacterium]
MNKGFTLIETLVSMTLVLLAVLFSARVTVFALAQGRNSLMRFRLIEKLDYYKNYLSSLSLSAPELAEGEHRQESREFRVSWRVEAAGAFLKRIDLLAAAPNYSLPLIFYKSKFIQEVQND